MSSHMRRRPEPEVMDIPAEADAYAAADFSQVNQVFVDRLLELAGELPRALALDVGTGPADIPIRIARKRPDWRIVAVDASEAMVALARKAVAAAGLTASIELRRIDAAGTGLEAGSFDIIFSNSILHHVNDVEALWREVKRLGRSGTVVLMRDLTRPEDEAAARRLVEQYAGSESGLLQEEYYRSLLAAYTPEEIGAQLARVGLNTLDVAMVSDRHMDVSGVLA
jgi:ubiquinone/menaquinone biosynthesis C-methylase UbiE